MGGTRVNFFIFYCLINNRYIQNTSSRETHITYISIYFYLKILLIARKNRKLMSFIARIDRVKTRRGIFRTKRVHYKTIPKSHSSRVNHVLMRNTKCSFVLFACFSYKMATLKHLYKCKDY